MDIPIVLFHKSKQLYVTYALRAAKKHNKIVTIITDVAAQDYSDYANVEQINSYTSAGSEELSKVYLHMSSNSYEFEYLCIERWFLLLEYMKRNRFEKVIYLDSDVIVYGNLTELIFKDYNKTDFCVCTPEQKYEDFVWSASGHISYWTYPALKQFCDFILHIYSEQKIRLEQKWQWHQENNIPGGINDMTLIYLFQKDTALQSGNFLRVMDNKYCFDNAIRGSRNEFLNEYLTTSSFLLGQTIKKITFMNGIPYCHNLILQKSIAFYCLHFQGDAKRIMHLFLRDQNKFRRIFYGNKQTFIILYSRIRQILSFQTK